MTRTTSESALQEAFPSAYTPFLNSTLSGEKSWGVDFPQAFFCKFFACLAIVYLFFSQLLPLFIGLFGLRVVRWSSWEKVVFCARQARARAKGVSF